MPAGLTVYNDSNTLQVDQNYKNLRYYGKATLSTTSVPNGDRYRNYQHADFTYTAVYNQPPMIAIESAAAGFIFLVSNTGNTFTFRVVFPLQGSSTSFTYWIFDQPNGTSSSTYGLQVFDEQGRLTFDALMGYPKYIDRFVVPSESAGTGGNLSYPIPAGKKYLPVQAVVGTYAQSNPVQQPGQPPSFARSVVTRLVRVDSTQIITEAQLVNISMTFAMPSIRRAAEYMVVDVTYL